MAEEKESRELGKTYKYATSYLCRGENLPLTKSIVLHASPMFCTYKACACCVYSCTSSPEGQQCPCPCRTRKPAEFLLQS